MCIGASEESGGSDLQIVQIEGRSVRHGFEVRGVKKFVSLSPVADHIMVVARGVDHDESSRHGNVLLIAVPTSQTDVQLPYRKVGAGPLDTAAVHIDTWVPADALIARPGTGLAAISWGLAHERMSIAGQVAAGCQRALGITHARMVDRRQFGSTLFEHQALRLRIADLQARVDLLRHGLNGIAADGRLDLAAAMKPDCDGHHELIGGALRQRASGTSAGVRGNAYDAIRRLLMSCSPRNAHPAYSHNRRAEVLRWSGSNMIRRQRGSTSKTLATIRGSRNGPSPLLTTVSSAMAACSPMS